jgi:2-polyprenyl-3-methyl-5-hydroxy-6-metoxy-1,4-benzoquinol methylase
MIGNRGSTGMSNGGPDSSRILEVGMGFWPSKTLLSAVELRLFTVLAEGPMTGERIADRLGLHPRPIYDFLDGLVALRFLERDGDGPSGRYRNTRDTAEFLDANKPTYIGGLLEMLNTRLYGFWGDLTEALQTGKPQNELKHGGHALFEELYSDPARLEQFMHAMAGISLDSSRALAERFDFSNYRTVCDVGGATGQLSMIIAERHPHLSCTSFDLPVVVPIAEKAIAAAGLSDRVKAAAGDFFVDPLPSADVITMARVLHDWNLDQKMRLIRAAYDALPDGGALITVESLIDDARREHVAGLMMSLNMLIEIGDAFDYSAADFAGWCREVGFRDISVLPLTRIISAAVAYK